MTIDKIILVYDADSGFRGELSYVAAKILKGASCSLCNITHGIREKAQWKRCKQALAVPVVQLHRNDLDPAMRDAVAGSFPLVLGATEGRYRQLLGPAELDECGGSVELFEALLRGQLEQASG